MQDMPRNGNGLVGFEKIHFFKVVLLFGLFVQEKCVKRMQPQGGGEFVCAKFDLSL